MFDFNHLHNELLNLDWTRIGWNCLSIGCLGLYLFKLGLTLGFYQLYPDDEDATETDEKNTEKIATNEKEICFLKNTSIFFRKFAHCNGVNLLILYRNFP